MSLYITDSYPVVKDNEIAYVRKIGHTNTTIVKRLSFGNTFMATPIRGYFEITSDEFALNYSMLEKFFHLVFEDYKFKTCCARELFVGLSDDDIM